MFATSAPTIEPTVLQSWRFLQPSEAACHLKHIESSLLMVAIPLIRSRRVPSRPGTSIAGLGSSRT